MLYISLHMNSEESDNNGNTQVINLFDDEFSYFLELQSVFNNADNIMLVESTDFGGGGGMNGTGGTKLVYKTESGNLIYLSIDGGFPIPELASMSFSCGSYNDK